MAIKKWLPLIGALAAAIIFFLPRPASAVDLGFAHFYGYIDLEYKQTTSDKFESSGPDDANLKNGAFDLHHLIFLLDATVSPNLFVKVQMEFEHGINSLAAESTVVMEYGFMEYLVDDWMKFRAGKMLTPWGIYNEIYDATPAYLTVFPPEVFYRADRKGGFMLMPKWTTGVAALGVTSVNSDYDDLDYIFYVGNGESRVTINDSENDDNINKAVGGRVLYKSHDEKFQLGASGYYGDKAVSRSRLEETHWTTSFQAELNWQSFNFHSEYGYSELGKQKEIAFYFQGSYRYERYTPYLRYETIDPDLGQNLDSWNTYLAGLNVKLTDYLFFKVEWNQHVREVNNEDIIIGEPQNYGEFRTAVAVLF